MEYYCHGWAGAPKYYLDILDRLQKRNYKVVGPALSVSLELMTHRCDMAGLSLFYRY